MKQFNYDALTTLTTDPTLVKLLTTIHEYRGQQAHYLTTNPELLTKLTDLAIIQSTDSSNEIEGIRTSDARLKALVAAKIQPQNRDEEEIAGYRDVLEIIHDSYPFIAINTSPSTPIIFWRYTRSFTLIRLKRIKESSKISTT